MNINIIYKILQKYYKNIKKILHLQKSIDNIVKKVDTKYNNMEKSF